MNTIELRSRMLSAAVVGLLTTGLAVGENEQGSSTRDKAAKSTQTESVQTARGDAQGAAAGTQEQVNEALRVVGKMKNDAQLTDLLQRARGVFIVPNFGKAALGIGGRGGEGVLLINRDGEWSGPAFYNFGRVSAGVQAGAAAGPVAMLLMSEDGVKPFTTQQNNFALDATADLTIVNYSAEARETAGDADVIMWSETDGLFAGASVGVSGFTRDEDENRAYYQQQASPQQIFSGSVSNPHADALRDALPTQTASR